MKAKFKEEVECFQKRIIEIEREIDKNELKPANFKSFISELRELTKEILQSQPYHEYADYRSKIQIWNKVSNNLDCQEELGLYGIKACFYLNARKREEDFWEGKLKGLANEITGRVEWIRQKFNLELESYKEWLSNHVNHSKSLYEDLDGRITKADNKIQQSKTLFQEVRTELKEKDDK